MVKAGGCLPVADLSLQEARPWHSKYTTPGSNSAADRARSLQSIFAQPKVVMFGVPAPFTGTW